MLSVEGLKRTVLELSGVVVGMIPARIREQVNAPDLYLDTPVTFSAGGVGYLLDVIDMWEFIP